MIIEGQPFFKVFNILIALSCTPYSIHKYFNCFLGDDKDEDYLDFGGYGLFYRDGIAMENCFLATSSPLELLTPIGN